MKAEELRIGNLYNHVASGVITLEADWISYFAKYPELLNGIPLTEEWLLRFGFEKDYDGNLNLYSKQLFTLKHYKGLKDVALLGYQNKVLGESVWYVHQLQNLYYALTNSELTLKETVI